VGKLYQIVARRMAEALVAEEAEVRAAECYLVSQIGRPITDPQIVDVRMETAPPSARVSESRVGVIVRRELDRLPTIWREILAEDIPVY
jgi:S-adenosylmethionine synthetase